MTMRPEGEFPRREEPTTVTDTDVNEALERGEPRDEQLVAGRIEHDPGAQPRAPRPDAPTGPIDNEPDHAGDPADEHPLGDAGADPAGPGAESELGAEPDRTSERR